ncbi:MAG TPA: acyl-CoA dehydrogenase [Anaerovoracaceae bacterium]|nr:acyl-CoA dehydrogenase [Anaerovoracaceae bacterium]
MDFNLTKKQKETRESAREFALREVKPIASEIDEEARFPLETIEKAAKLGFMGYPFPKEYGGHGADYVSYVIMVEEISKVCASTGVIVQTHSALCSWPILTYGTEEQKQKYLPNLYSGKTLGAFGLTEPGAGSDAGSIKTTATDMGDYWLLNGSKIFISGGGIAGVYVVFAMTDIAKGTRGISAFIVEKGMEGFSFSEKQNKMGIRGSLTSELFFKDCKVPKENLLGEINKGLRIALSALDVGRLGIAAQALGIAQGAFDQTVEYMKTREQFGRPIFKFQALAFEMADMKTKIDAARFMLYYAADRREKGLPGSVEAAQAKLICSETAMHVTTKAVQFHGGYGYLKEYPIERMMRDAKITEIYEGTSEVMKIIISGEIFK